MTDYNFDYVYNTLMNPFGAAVIQGDPTAASGPVQSATDPLNYLDTVVYDGVQFTYYGWIVPDGMLLVDEELNAIVLSNDANIIQNTPITITPEKYPFCLMAGTWVATPGGERLVEDLRPSDVVLTADGEPVEVRWVGRQSLPRFAADAAPVVISAGALADSIPVADLRVSADHAILIDGYLVNAHALVNGTTVYRADQADLPPMLDYYHLELDRHRVIVANGTPVESFVDDVTRQGFDNFDEWVALDLQPLPAEPIEYLKVKSARQLPATISQRLNDRRHSPTR